jgi:hypothetical protein
MDEPEEIEYTPDVTPLPIQLRSGQRYAIIVKKQLLGTHMLMMEDLNFHFDSAVMLPGPVEPADVVKNGIVIIAALFKFLKSNPDKILFLAGHTDTKGDPTYNKELSWKRSNNILTFIKGDAKNWESISKSKYQIEDVQYILKWLYCTWGWNTDPGKIDNIFGDKSIQALKNFRNIYNSIFNASLKESSMVTDEYWNAFFNLYNEELKWQMECTDEELGQLREKINFLEPATSACGEAWPIDKVGVDGCKSETNRRVELLLFDAGKAPALSCGKSGCKNADECPVYGVSDFGKSVNKIEIKANDSSFSTYIVSADINQASLELNVQSGSGDQFTFTPSESSNSKDGSTFKFDISKLNQLTHYSVGFQNSSGIFSPLFNLHAGGLNRVIGNVINAVPLSLILSGNYQSAELSTLPDFSGNIEGPDELIDPEMAV